MDEGTKNQRIKVIFSERIGPDSYSSVLSSHHDCLNQVPQPQEEVIPLVNCSLLFHHFSSNFKPLLHT